MRVRNNSWSLRLVIFLFLTLGSFFFHCGIEEDTGFAVVRELRIAAVVAEPPELAPGDEVTLIAYSVDPEGRDLAYLWFNPPEFIEPNKGIPEEIQPIGFDQRITWKAPERTGTYTLIVLTVPVEYLPELVGVQNFESLENIPHALAFKKITVSDSLQKNHNPVIEDISITPSYFEPGDTITLTAVASDPDSDELQFAWISTQKGLSSDYKNPVEFKVPNDGLPAIIYLIVRDMRGGSALSSIEILPR